MLATDLSSAMVDLTAQRARAAGLGQVATRQADASQGTSGRASTWWKTLVIA